MFKKTTASLLLSIMMVLMITNASYSQSDTASKYELVNKNIVNVLAAMRAASTGGDLDAWNIKNDELVVLRKEKKDLEKILSGDKATRDAINAVKQLVVDGNSAMKTRRNTVAARKYNEAITKGLVITSPMIQSVLAKAYSGQATLNNRLKKYSDSKLSISKAITIVPDSKSYYYTLGVAEQGGNNFDDAERSYKKSIELDPKYVPAHYKLGSLYFAKKMFNKAADSFLSAVEIRPNYANTFTYLGRSYFSAKKPQSARGAFEQAIEITPKDHIAYYFLAQIHNQERNYSQAIQAADGCLKVKRGFGGAYIEQGIAYKGLGNKVKALDMFRLGAKDRRYKESADHHILILTKFDKGGE